MVSNFKIAFLLSYISLASFSAVFITPALPQIATWFDLQNGQVEWVVSAFLIGYVIGQLIYGPLANRWGRVTALQTGLVINLIGIALCIMSLVLVSYSLMIFGRFFSALGAASGLACTFMLINEWLHESQRKTAMAYTILSFTFGIGLAVTLGGIISEYLNWVYCFLFLGIHGILMLAGTKLFKETLKQPQPINLKSIIEGYKKAISSRTLIIFSLVVGFCSSIGYCFSAAGPQISIEMFQLSPAEYGYWNLINMIGMLGGGLWSKSLLNRLPAKQVIKLGLSGCAIGILGLIVIGAFHLSSPIWFFLCTLIMYLFSGLLFAGGSLIASNALADKASCSAMMSFINMSLATLAVVIMGYLTKNPLQAFVEVLISLWLLIVILLLVDKWLSYRQVSLCNR
ncbi:MAG: MFS transporter [Tatlockia sp.]|nr:MFS transporter [Tatlockia sp.]